MTNRSTWGSVPASPVTPFVSSILLLLMALPTALAGGELRYNRNIRPILSENCFYCHGQDANHRKAELRLDLREEAVKTLDSGFAPIVSGKPEESELIR